MSFCLWIGQHAIDFAHDQARRITIIVNANHEITHLSNLIEYISASFIANLSRTAFPASVLASGFPFQLTARAISSP